MSQRSSLMIDHTRTILNFLTEIELAFELQPITEKTFLPGLILKHGVLLIDKDKLLFPGDILHEAGHVAVCEPIFRECLKGNIFKNGLLVGREKQAMYGEEMAATAWAVAAAKHLSIPLDIIFHSDSYRGANNTLINDFESGNGFGFPLLQAWQMTCPEAGYPNMVKWIRDLRWVESRPNETQPD